ncbi:MAG: ABC transporter substrate-binding protein [Acetivibrionales bacterium]|jgi:peptide/nickel transport system substrate-binding protein
MKNRNRFTLIALVLATIMLFTGCGAPKATETPSGTQPATTPTATSTGTSEPKQDMVLRMGIASSLATGDPHMSGLTTVQEVLINIFDPLVRRDSTGALQPKLALSWKVVEPQIWELKLREGVKFHNGEPFNAEAVKFSLERIFKEGSKSPIQELRSFESVEAVDEYTVRIHTKAPDPRVPDKLALFAGMMVPPKYIQEKGEEYFNSNPVGTGAFIFKEWVKDSHITMTGNPDYWDEPTKITELTMKFIPDSAARVAALLSGDVDIINMVDSTTINSIKSNSNLRLDIAEGIRIYYMSTAYPDGPTANPKVRQAISHAIDYQQLIDSILGGYGLRIPGPFNTSNFGSDVKLTPYEYNVEKAKSLLAEAGYPNGFDIEMNIDSEGSVIGQPIAMMLKQAGINVNLKILPDAEYEDKYSQGKLAPLWINGYSVWQGDPSTLIETFFKTGMPRAKYFSPELDAKIVDMLSTMDINERKVKLHDVLTILYNDSPWSYLYQANDLFAVKSSVKWDIPYDRMLEMRTATITK